MSSYVRRIGVEVYGNVSGFLASLNQMNAGITRTASGLRQGSQQAGVFNGQLRAIGTTAKYALAGELVFGITGALSKLSQLQVAIGNISTVATQPGGAAGLKGPSSFAQQLIDESNRAIIPVQNLTDTVTALYSSLKQNLPQSDILNLTREIAQIARVSQVGNPQDLVGTLLGGATAFGMPQGAGPGGLSRSVMTLGDQFRYVLQKSRNMTGVEYAQYSGNLYKRAGVAGLTPEQTGALAIQSTMLGGPASTNMQNLSQFLLYLRNPKSASSKRAYAQAGITQADLISSAPGSGWALITKLMQHAASLPSGQRAQFISGAFGRMQSQSTFATLLKAGGMGALDQQITGLKGSVGDVKRSFDAFKQQAPLAYLANTMSNLGTTLAEGIPGLNLTARGLGRGLQAFEAPGNTKVRDTIMAGVSTVLAGRTLSALFPNKVGARLARIPGIGRLLGGNAANKMLSAGIMAEEASAVSTGGTPDGSRANPIWVIISPWSWTVGSPGGFGSPVGSTQTTTQSEAQKGASLFTRIVGKLSGGAGAAYGAVRSLGVMGAGTVAAAASLPLVAQEAYQWLRGSSRAVPRNHPALSAFANPSNVNAFGLHEMAQNRTPLEQNILDRFINGGKGGLTADQAERRLAALRYAGDNAQRVTKITVSGEANGTFLVKLVDKDGNVISTVQERGVPVRLWDAKSYPSSQGKPGTRKGGGK